METGENVEQVKNVENSEPVVSETSASVSGNNGKSLSKSARNRRNKRLRNQEKPNDSQNGTPNQGDGSEKKLTLEEKMQRRKHFMELNEEKNILQALRKIRGPTIGLPEQPVLLPKKFSSDCRLYVGGIPKDTTVGNIEELFTPFGEVSDIYVSTGTDKQSAFALLRMDSFEHMEQARRRLNRSTYKGRKLFVHASRKPCAIRVKNLNGSVTSELLRQSFEVFGEVERAIVTMTANDDSSGEGIVTFSTHSSAQTALRYCSEECFFLTASFQPVICELFNGTEEKVAFSEADIDTNTSFYLQERSVGARFAESPAQHEYGRQYKQLFAAFEYKKNQLQEEFKLALYNLHREIKLIQCSNELEFLRRQIHPNDGYMPVNATTSFDDVGNAMNQQRNKKWNKKLKQKARSNQNPSTSAAAATNSVYGTMQGGESSSMNRNFNGTINPSGRYPVNKGAQYAERPFYEDIF